MAASGKPSYEELQRRLAEAESALSSTRRGDGRQREAKRLADAELALRASEEKFSKAFHTSPYAITITRADDGKMIEVNQAFCSITGYGREEALASTTPALDLWADLADREQVVADLAASRPVVAREYRFRMRNGELITALFSAQPLQLDDQLCILSSINDITAHKQAEAALAESERLKALVLDSTAEMVTYYDPELRVVWANRAAAESVGSTTEQLVGRHCYQIWAGNEAPCPGCPVLEAKETKSPCQAEQQTSDGRWWLLRGYPVLDEDGTVVALVEFGQDITEHKRAEQERRRLEAQFQQAQKLESIGRLAGGVAHDLNNMLAPILGYGGILLEDTSADHPHHPLAREITRAAERARDLVRQLLAFSRKQTLEFKLVDFNVLVADFENLLRRSLRDDIALRLELAPDLPAARGDAGQLEQVLMNLAVNAQDAMPEGGRLSITTAAVELDAAQIAALDADGPGEPGPHIALEVRDDGCGMDAEVRDHLFEPFYTTKPKDKGTGLGLATIYGIVRQHGGHIRVDSEPDRGATFTIYLPAAPAGAAQRERPRPRPRARHGDETVLLVEDDAAVRRLAARILETNGYRVLSAANGGDALALAEGDVGPLHLLLTDVVMPDMNGKQLYERLAADRPELAVIYMSGYADDVIARHGVLDEDAHFIQKPFDKADLATRIRQVLDEERQLGE